MQAPRDDLLLWENQHPTQSYMWEFLQRVNSKYHTALSSYDDLYTWSIDCLPQFWEEVWAFTGVEADSHVEPANGNANGHSKGYTNGHTNGHTNGNTHSSPKRPFKHVIEDNAPMFPRPKFFDGCTLNFADNLLFPRDVTDPNATALISVTESTSTTVTWAELRRQVRELVRAMKALGVRPRDRVAGFLGNHANTVVAMLATTFLGAVWTAVSPDTGVAAVLDRLVQIEPVLLFADNGVEYNGRTHSSTAKTREIAQALPQLKAVVVFQTVPGVIDISNFKVAHGRAWTHEGFLQSAPPADGQDLKSMRVMFSPDHPVYILYSSGTTGKPKCIVHSAAGTLIQHKKEHVLHCDIRPGYRLLYYTTTSWMMWHWLVSALASSASIVLYDGSPFKPHGDLTMARLIQDLRITQFGTSAKYISILEQNGAAPLAAGLDLSSLRAIYSTGSPLAPSTFRYVYDAFPRSVNLGSITGGTDIISLFGAPCPLAPVYEGEIQVRGLGMAVSAVDHEGQPVAAGEPGDLVCTRPFPSQPVGFWPATYAEEPAAASSVGVALPRYDLARYEASYFALFPGIWHHGDFVRFNPATGGMVMLGRSDGILKPAGVRFGSAEIYNVLLAHFAAEVEDSLCIGRRRAGDVDEKVVLFLKMVPGRACDDALKARIAGTIRADLSARHVPAIIDECPEIPVTTNGKKIEVAVKQILCGMNIKTSASVANAQCLDWYRDWARRHEGVA